MVFLQFLLFGSHSHYELPMYGKMLHKKSPKHIILNSTEKQQMGLESHWDFFFFFWWAVPLRWNRNVCVCLSVQYEISTDMSWTAALYKAPISLATSFRMQIPTCQILEIVKCITEASLNVCMCAYTFLHVQNHFTHVLNWTFVHVNIRFPGFVRYNLLFLLIFMPCKGTAQVSC